MFENGPSDKMQFRGMGELIHPANCISCGNGTNPKGYVAPGVSLEWEGELYFCWTCTVQMAEIIGMMIPEEVEIIQEHNNVLIERNEALRKENGELRERLDAFDVIMRSLPPVAVADAVGGMVSEDVGPVGFNESRPASPVSSEPTGTESESPEPTKGPKSRSRAGVKFSDASDAAEPAVSL